MITYENKGIAFVVNLFRRNGSVFPKALVLGLPISLMSSAFVHILHTTNLLHAFKDPDSVMSNNSIWGGFSFAIGFLVIFRTSQAYARFWEGCTNMHKMGAEWYDACGALMAFTKHSEKPVQEVMKFQNMLIRLFSMLHSAACGEIEESVDQIHHTHHPNYAMELIDAGALSDDCLLAIQNSDAKTEMILQWIQQYIVLNIKTGILSIPPPILSRSFQEIAQGMVHFNEAMKIANVPFPFPYAQTCDMLLLLHWFAVPFVVSQWVLKPWWAGIFAFIMVFTLWTLNFIAIELENPFGTDPNDIDGPGMQRDMNTHLRTLIRDDTLKTPTLKSESKSAEQELEEQEDLRGRALGEEEGSDKSFTELWKDLSAASGSTNYEMPATRFRATVAPGVKPIRSAKKNRKQTSEIYATKSRDSGIDSISVRDDTFHLVTKRVDSELQPASSLQAVSLQRAPSLQAIPPVQSVQAVPSDKSVIESVESPLNETLVEDESPRAVALEPGREQSRNLQENVGYDQSRSASSKQERTAAAAPAGRDQSCQTLAISMHGQPVATSLQGQTMATSMHGQPMGTSMHGHDRSLRGNGMLENAGSSLLVSVDQQVAHDPRAFVGVDQQVPRDHKVIEVNSPSRSIPKALRDQVPHLMPRMLAEKCSVTPRGGILQQLPPVIGDAALQLSQRTSYSGDPMPTHRSSQSAGSPTQRSSQSASPPSTKAMPMQPSGDQMMPMPEVQRALPSAAASAANVTGGDGAMPPMPRDAMSSIQRPPASTISYSSPSSKSRTRQMPSRPSQTGMGSFTSCMRESSRPASESSRG